MTSEMMSRVAPLRRSWGYPSPSECYTRLTLSCAFGCVRVRWGGVRLLPAPPASALPPVFQPGGHWAPSRACCFCPFCSCFLLFMFLSLTRRRLPRACPPFCRCSRLQPAAVLSFRGRWAPTRPPSEECSFLLQQRQGWVLLLGGWGGACPRPVLILRPTAPRLFAPTPPFGAFFEPP